MQQETTKKSFTQNSPFILILLCFAVYFIAYLGRYSYSSNINRVIDYFNLNRAEAGSVGTYFFVSYGIGQVFHGLMCKKYNPRYAIFLALFISAGSNLAVVFTNENAFNLLKIYWLVNGFAQATLWSSLIRLLNTSLPKKKLSTAVFIMGLPVSAGTFAIYGLSSLMSAIELSFKSVFVISAVLLLVISIIWFLFVDKLKDASNSQKEEGEIQAAQSNASSKVKEKLPTVFLVTFSLLALFAVANNFVKDGLTTWMPTILKEEYSLTNSISTFLTLFLPFFAVFGSTFAIFLNKKLKNYILVCGVLYLLSFVLFIAVILLLKQDFWLYPLVCFIIIACAMSGVNNVITNIFPMLYSSKINSGAIAGVLDGFCYIGSAITAYGMGKVADNYGWNKVFYFFIAVCCVMMLLSIAYFVVSKLIEKTKNKQQN